MMPPACRDCRTSASREHLHSTYTRKIAAPAPVEIRLLGPIELVVGGHSVAWHGQRKHALLARLALDAGKIVRTQMLVGAVWGDAPTAAATANLHTYVSQLRALAGRDAVRTGDLGYTLDVPDAAVDALVLRSTARNHEADVESIRRALQLWRGNPLDGLDDLDWCRETAVMLDHHRVDLVERRIDLDLASAHDPGRLVAELEQLVIEHPFRERMWCQLMRAQYRAMRQVDALRTYQRLRSLLLDQLGIEPGFEAAELERAILLQNDELLSAELGHPLPVDRQMATTSMRSFPGLPALPSTPIVGREDHRAELWRAWQEASDGRVCLVTIEGEPGIGKTTLAVELADAVEAAGGLVLTCRCDEHLSVPYAPVTDALGQLLERFGVDELRAAAGLGSTALAVLLPELADPFGQTRRGQRQLVAAVAQLFAAISRAAPLLLVVDDVQWADRSTLVALRHLTLSAHRARILVVATLRDTDVSFEDPSRSMITELIARGAARRLSLAGLAVGDVGQLIVHLRGADGPPMTTDFLDEIASATGGNPFFVIESINHQAAVSREPIPQRIAALLDQRVKRLGPEAGAVLVAAAVLGGDIDVAVLGATERLGGLEVVVERLKAAVGAGLIHENSPGRYQFVHALVRQVLAARLGQTERAALHARLGAAIADIHRGREEAQAPRLAYHYLAAAPLGYGNEAAQAALHAGTQAMAVFALSEAIAVLEQGVGALVDHGRDDPALEAHLHLALAEVHDKRAETSATEQSALSAAAAARRSGSPELLAEAVWWFSRRSHLGRNPDQVIRLAEEVLAALGDSHPVLRARLLANLGGSLAFAGLTEQAQRAADSALDLARSTGDDATIAEALLEQLWTRRHAPDFVDMIAAAHELIAIAPDEWRRAEGLRLRAALLLSAGDLAGFDRDRDELARLSPRVPVIPGVVQVTQWQALRALLHGRFDEAETYANEATNLAPDNENTAMIHAGHTVWRLLETGADQEALETYRMGVHLYPQMPVFRTGEALALARLRRHEDAKAALTLLLRDDIAFLPDDLLRPFGIAFLAEVATEVGDTQAAAALMPHIAPYAGQLLVVPSDIAVMASFDRFLAMLASVQGDDAAADRSFSAALQLEEQVAAEPLAARTRYWWARSCTSRDPVRAAGLCAEAAAITTRLGMIGLTRSIEALQQTTATAR